jgi:MFS family permease
MIISIVGFVVLISSKNAVLRYGFVHICMAGAGAGGPIVAAWLTDNTPDRGTRSIVIGLNGYSNVAGVIAGQLYKPKYAPSYNFPLKITMILISMGACGYVSMRFVYMFLNRKRTRLIANWTPEQFEEEYRNSKRRGNRKLTFIYGY